MATHASSDKLRLWPATRRGRVIATVCLVVAFSLLAWILYTFNPELVSFYPRCPSKFFFDVDCPGCGTARGLHALLHGNVARAWHFNPALFVILPFLAMYLWAISRPVGSRWYRLAYSPYVPAGLLVLAVLWTLARNLFLNN